MTLGVLGAVALVLAFCWFAFWRAQPRELSGRLTLVGACPSTQGVQIVVRDPGGMELGAGPVRAEQLPEGCDLVFSFVADRSDAYAFAVRLDEGTETTDWPGPTFNPDELAADNWTVALQASEFPRMELPG